MNSPKKSTVSLVAAIFALLLALTFASPAYASGFAQDICEANDGTWSGPNNMNGTCTYVSGDIIAVTNCGAGYSYLVYFVADAETGSDCIADPSPDLGGTTANSDVPTTLNLGGEKNGSATFPAGTCPQQCTISPSLPNNAANDLPADALATMYMRVVDEGGVPGSGTYTVCFNNPNHELVTIYRFVSGAWVAVAVSEGSPICTTASGDGSFYLGN